MDQGAVAFLLAFIIAVVISIIVAAIIITGRSPNRV